MGDIFGGEKETTTQRSVNKSWNDAYPQISQNFGSTMGQTGQASNAIGNLLGLGGQPAQTGAFDNFRNNTGYNFRMNQGIQGVEGSRAAKGLLGSGASMKALNDYGQGMASQSFNDYLGQLNNLGNMGMQAGNLVTQAGQRSEGTSQSDGKTTKKNGFGGLIGQTLAGFGISDRRLKTDIKKLSEIVPGLNLYEFRYKNGKNTYRGVMSDEVRHVMPEAVLEKDGYDKVNYDMLQKEYGSFTEDF